MPLTNLDLSIRVTIASNHQSQNMPPPTSDQPAPATAKPARLTRARRATILKTLADPRRFEILERIAKAGCPLGCTQARAAGGPVKAPQATARSQGKLCPVYDSCTPVN